MTIQITRGPQGSRSPVISFVGTASDGTSSADVFNNVFNITAIVNIADTDRVDVYNNNLTATAGETIYVIRGVSYTDWIDENGNTFDSAIDVVAYINNQATESVTNLINRVSSPIGGGQVVTVGVNSSFEYKAQYQGGAGFYWSESSFPPNVEVSRYDRRKISGTISSTGSYVIDYEVANVNGITSSFVTINVV